MITVLLVDDHAYIRNGIQSLLEATPDIVVAATAANGVEGVAKASSYQPDVVIIDISMPFMNGIEATKQIHASCPRTHILGLSIFPDKEFVQSALEAGAQGYLLKDQIGDELIEAIYALQSGRRFFSRKIAEMIHPSIEEDNGGWVG
ncbi:MAG TPA: response regulator transcription factor [Anaerolineales bacterium]|jgi:two-component system response regulator DegU|nr:response regulator transcription factor [Anaerolineales bacterium]